MKRLMYGFLLFSAGLMFFRDAATLALATLEDEQPIAISRRAEPRP